MKREFKERAILLKRADSGESSVIATFFGEESGQLTLYAPSGKKSRRRFGSALDSFTLSEIIYKKKSNGYHTLSSAEVLDPFPSLRTELRAFAAASYAAELYLSLTKEGEASPELFQLLYSYLSFCQTRPLSPKALSRFHLRLLELLGYRPNWENCLECGRYFSEEFAFFFDPQQGGILCAECASVYNHLINFPPHLQRHLTQLQERTELTVTPPPWRQTLLLLQRRIDFLLGIPPKSRAFLFTYYPSLNPGAGF